MGSSRTSSSSGMASRDVWQRPLGWTCETLPLRWGMLLLSMTAGALGIYSNPVFDGEASVKVADEERSV